MVNSLLQKGYIGMEESVVPERSVGLELDKNESVIPVYFTVAGQMESISNFTYRFVR